MTLPFEAHEIPNAVIVTAAVLAALGVWWRKVVVPFRDWVRKFKAWMDRIEAALIWVESQMRPNGGSTLVDKVNMLLDHDAQRDVAGRRYGPDTTSTEESP